jgi:O-antigen/teichoic acid export membrane protein
LSTLKKFAGQTAVYGISTVLSRVLNFFLTRLYVSAYPAKIYGIFVYMYGWVSMFNAILAFGMETTFFRYLNKHEKDKQKVYNNTFIVILACSIIFIAIAVLFSENIATWMQKGGETSVKDYASYIRYFIFIIATDAISIIPFAKVRADGKPLRYGLLKLINILTFIGFNIFFIILIPHILKNGGEAASYFSGWYREGWLGYVFISNLIASAVTLSLLLPELIQIELKADRSLIKDMLVYSFPVLIANISFIINENVDKIFLKELLPPNSAGQQVGIYGACCKIALFLSIFIQAFRLGAEPFFFNYAKNKNSGETYSKIMNYFVIAVSLIFVGLVANIEILKYFIKANDPLQKQLYWSGLTVVPILLFGYVSLGIYMNLSIWYKLSDQTRYGLYISGVGAIVTIVMNILFIPRYSYIASAWISLAAYISMMVLSYILGQRNYPIPYNLKKISGYLITSIVIVILSFNYFNRSLIAGNIMLAAFALGAFLIERKELQTLFKNENPDN